jgi:hypothetical protein
MKRKNKLYKFFFFKKDIFSRLISKAFSFDIEPMDLIEYNPVKIKLLTALSKYTGYYNVNVIVKPLNKYNNVNLENKYNIFFSYIKMYYNGLTKNFFLSKYKTHNLEKNIIVNNLSLYYNKFDEFLKTFPFFFIKIFKDFLSNIFELLNLKHYSIIYKYKLLADSFNYILEYYDGHFFKAFKFYKLFLLNSFNFNLINTYGIRIIVKGRFGKVRKQIEKLVIGSLNLNTIIKNINYFNNILNTKRGSYGFHIWFCEKLGIEKNNSD